MRVTALQARFLCSEAGPSAVVVHSNESDTLQAGEEKAVSASEEVPASGYLKSLGFGEQKRERLLSRYPGLKRVSFDRPLSPKLEFLSQRGMSRAGMTRFFADVLHVYPEFLDLDLETEIVPVFGCLSELGLSDEEVLVMVARYPHLVGFDVEGTIRDKVAFLRDLFPGDDGSVARIALSFPQLFGVSLDGNLRPVATYLAQEMGLDEEGVRKTFSRCPQLFGVRLSAARAKLDFMIQCGFDIIVVRALVKRFPAFLRASLQDDLRPTMEILLEYGTKESIAALFYRCPQCLCLSYENEILPKFRFLCELGYDPFDLGLLLEQFPELLCHSLEDEIMPAVQKSVDVGLSLLETRITFAREPEMFRETIAKVARDERRERKRTALRLPC